MIINCFHCGLKINCGYHMKNCDTVYMNQIKKFIVKDMEKNMTRILSYGFGGCVGFIIYIKYNDKNIDDIVYVSHQSSKKINKVLISDIIKKNNHASYLSIYLKYPENYIKDEETGQWINDTTDILDKYDKNKNINTIIDYYSLSKNNYDKYSFNSTIYLRFKNDCLEYTNNYGCIKTL